MRELTIPRVASCPVCHMPVETAHAAHTAEMDGEMHFFCAEGCRRRWLEDNTCCDKPKGRWGRYLERLGRANEEVFGAGGPKCH